MELKHVIRKTILNENIVEPQKNVSCLLEGMVTTERDDDENVAKHMAGGWEIHNHDDNYSEILKDGKLVGHVRNKTPTHERYEKPGQYSLIHYASNSHKNFKVPSGEDFAKHNLDGVHHELKPIMDFFKSGEKKSSSANNPQAGDRDHD